MLKLEKKIEGEPNRSGCSDTEYEEREMKTPNHSHLPRVKNAKV